MLKTGKPLHSLVPLSDFKAVLGIDEREDAMSRYCLLTATYSIEQYCRRRLVLSMSREQISMSNEQGTMSNEDVLFYLREFPVREILSVSISNGALIEPDFYSVVPDCGSDENFPYCLSLSPALLRLQGVSSLRVIYKAGYKPMSNEQGAMNNGAVPADLASACLELAAWNMARYRSRRIGVVGNVRGAGMDKEHFEIAMPENVRGLLEPYKRKLI